MDFSPSLQTKKFYRFTGTPENWLTAIKFMTWGLKPEYEHRWQEIETGDVFFMHSTANSLIYPQAPYGIIGIGIVGSNFSKKSNFLWIDEQEKKENIWPFLVPFSEIYLFSEIPDRTTWEAPNSTNALRTKQLIELLLRNRFPLANIPAFPKMGSFSSVKDEVKEAILNHESTWYTYRSENEDGTTYGKPTQLLRITSARETLRYADTLEVFDKVKHRIVRKDKTTFLRDNETLARATESHGEIEQNLIDIFRKKGYDVYNNKHVDFYAHNGKRSFLIEVKSTENENFRSQARKGIIQLFECDFFDIKKFKKEQNISFNDEYKILVPSREPKDEKYIDFINSLELGVATIREDALIPRGKDFGVSNI